MQKPKTQWLREKLSPWQQFFTSTYYDVFILDPAWSPNHHRQPRNQGAAGRLAPRRGLFSLSGFFLSLIHVSPFLLVSPSLVSFYHIFFPFCVLCFTFFLTFSHFVSSFPSFFFHSWEFLTVYNFTFLAPLLFAPLLFRLSCNIIHIESLEFRFRYL